MYETMEKTASYLYDCAFRAVDLTDRDSAEYVANAVREAFRTALSRCPKQERADNLASQIILDAWRKGDVQYKLSARIDDANVYKNVTHTETRVHDAFTISGILARLGAEDIWAWAFVEITCRVPNYASVGTACLGCCTFENEEDFRRGESFDDLRRTARKALQARLAKELQLTT